MRAALLSKRNVEITRVRNEYYFTESFFRTFLRWLKINANFASECFTQIHSWSLTMRLLTYNLFKRKMRCVDKYNKRAVVFMEAPVVLKDGEGVKLRSRMAVRNSTVRFSFGQKVRWPTLSTLVPVVRQYVFEMGVLKRTEPKSVF